MISGSVVVPFQKGPCGEGGRMRGFLLPLLEAAVVVLVLVLLLILFSFFPLFSQHLKVNKINFVEHDFERMSQSLWLFLYTDRSKDWK